MASFRLNSDVTIGRFRFSGVHEVRVRRGLHGLVDMAIIRIPSIGRVRQGKLNSDGSVTLVPGSARDVTVGSLFTDGDPVTIKLGYNGDMREEFRGFVKRRNLNMPLEIECEGYARLMRLQVDQTGNYTEGIQVKKLLELAVQGTGIKVVCTVDFKLTGIYLHHANGIQIVEHIRRCSANALNVFFIEPDVLWCGLVYTPYVAGNNIYNTPTVSYRLGWNVVKDNGLKERIPTEPVQIIMNGKVVSGDMVRTASKDKTAARKEKYLMNNVPDAKTLEAFAQELQLNMNYQGYEGAINGFLQPFCLAGYNANIVDARYPERNGVYLVESAEVLFGTNGARRRVDIGPKLS
jgi:hypothetical protein